MKNYRPLSRDNWIPWKLWKLSLTNLILDPDKNTLQHSLKRVCWTQSHDEGQADLIETTNNMLWSVIMFCMKYRWHWMCCSNVRMLHSSVRLELHDTDIPLISAGLRSLSVFTNYGISYLSHQTLLTYLTLPTLIFLEINLQANKLIIQ